MRAIDARHLAATHAQHRADGPGEDAALGAMTVQDIGLEIANVPVEAACGFQVARGDLAPHRETRDAEGELRGEAGNGRILERAAGRSVANDANLMAGPGLGDRQIRDVAENAADRSADDMNDAQGRGGHLKNSLVQRVCMPGLFSGSGMEKR